MAERLYEYVESLKGKNSAWVVDVAEGHGELTMIVPRESIADICSFLKSDQQFDLLADLCGCDRGPEEEPRFEVNYHLFSTKHFNRIRLKVLVSEEDAHVPSV